MENALQLEGYLLKEKSKLSRLHGLTGDINKRYFRIRSVEGSPELALCYFKSITDAEVRGWIYLKDVTEIAENQDIIILTSTARTLHLYAETRAEHNAWVTGLAMLCPDAIKILGRNASAQKTAGALPAMSSDFALATSANLIDKSLSRDRRNLPHETPAADDNAIISVNPDVGHNVDNEGRSPSTDENDARPDLLETPREAVTRVELRGALHRDKSTGRQPKPDERRGSRTTPLRDSQHVRATNAKRDNGDAGHPSHNRVTRVNSPGNEGILLGGVDEKGRTRCSKEERRGCRSLGTENRSAKLTGALEKQDPVVKTVGSTTSSRMSTDSTDNRTNTPNPTTLSSSVCRRSQKAKGNETNKHEKVDNKRDTERSEQCSTEVEAGSYEDKGVVARTAHGTMSTRDPRPESSDSENLETIELREAIRSADRQTRRHESSASERANMLKRSNQDEDRELDDEADIDLVVPIEVKAWDGPYQWQSATSRLHRHISRSDAPATGTSNIPPPKEFLPRTPIESLVKVPEVGGVTAEAGQGHGPASTRSGGLANKCTRRRRAVDLEWNDGGETPDRPTCPAEKLAQPSICGPVDLGDSEGDGGDDLDAEIKKQQRRAAAAVLALQLAAKEADEGAQVQSEPLGDFKRRGNSVARGIVPKYSSPAGPPPAALIRKTRRGSAGPTPWVAPAKTTSPARDNFLSNDRNNEIKTARHSSPVAGGRHVGGLPTACP